MESKKLKDYFKPFLDYKEAETKSVSTKRQYRRFIKCLTPIGEKRLSELNINDDVLIRVEGRKHGHFGEQRAVVIFRVFLKWLEREGNQLPFRWEQIENENPRSQNKQYFLTQEEFDDFVSKIPLDTFYGLRNRFFYETLWSTGLRMNEALSINMKDIDYDAEGGPEIFVNRLKGSTRNTVYISDRMMEWLGVYLQKKPEHEALFVTVDKGDVKRMSGQSATEFNLKYRKQFGVTKQLNHMSLRRGYTNNLWKNGADMVTVQELAGHESPKTTMKSYIEYQKKQAKAIFRKIYNQAPKTEMTELAMGILNKNKEIG